MNKEQFLSKVNSVPKDSMTHIITIIQLPTGAKEVIINSDKLEEKIEYINNSYDDDMIHKYAKVKEGELPVRILDCAIS